MSDTYLGYLLAGGALLLFTASILITKAASARLDLGLGFLIATSTNVVFSALALGVQMQLRTDSLQWNLPAFLMDSKPFSASKRFTDWMMASSRASSICALKEALGGRVLVMA